MLGLFITFFAHVVSDYLLKKSYFWEQFLPKRKFNKLRDCSRKYDETLLHYFPSTPITTHCNFLFH